MKKKLVLFGAGISGLSCLYFFLKKHSKEIAEIEIYEKDSTIGGVLKHLKNKDFLLESGAQGVLSNREFFTHLLEQLNLKDRVIYADKKSTRKAFFFKNQIILISPRNLRKLLKLKLLSIWGIFRIFFEIFISKPKHSISNETVAQFFTRRFGVQVSKNFLTPMMKGIWGGGASQILLRFAFPKLYKIENKHRSILKYFLQQKFSFNHKGAEKKELLSFKSGMVELPQKILEKIQQICETEKISFKVIFNHHEKLRSPYDLLIYSGQPWLDNSPPVNFSKHAYEVLKKIPTHSLLVVGIGSVKEDLDLKFEGFGALAVENNREGVLGVIAVHSLYPEHVPEDGFFYRVILGGENLPSFINMDTVSDKDIIQLAKTYLENHNLLHKNKEYEFESVIKHRNYLPLPTTYQPSVIEAVQEIESKMHGVFLVGNYIGGPSIENCIETAQAAADRMSKYISCD